MSEQVQDAADELRDALAAELLAEDNVVAVQRSWPTFTWDALPEHSRGHYRNAALRVLGVFGKHRDASHAARLYVALQVARFGDTPQLRCWHHGPLGSCFHQDPPRADACNACAMHFAMFAAREVTKCAEQLLAACKTSLEFWHSDHPNDTVAGHTAREQVRAAVAAGEKALNNRSPA